MNDNCIFCKIVSREIPAKIIAENDYAIAFMDAFPASDGHCLVIPKKHFIDLEHTDDDYLCEIIKMTKKVAKAISCDKKIDPWGINYLCNQGDIAGQVVKHTHIHIIPKHSKNEGFSFSSDKKCNLSIDEAYESILQSYKKVC